MFVHDSILVAPSLAGALEPDFDRASESVLLVIFKRLFWAGPSWLFFVINGNNVRDGSFVRSQW